MNMQPVQFYSAANLKENPFRSNPTQESDPRMDIWVGYGREKEQFWRQLVRSRADQIGNANLVLLYGDLGTGKSHALFWAKYQILVALKDDFNSVAYYVQTLRKDAGKITFAGAFREDIVGKSSLVSDVRHFRQFLEECIIEYKRDHGLGPEVTKEVVLEKLLHSIELFNFGKEILRCETEEQVRDLLLPPRLGDYQAMMTLTKLINLFVFEIKVPSRPRRFKNGAYLFIDELDLLTTATAKEARDVNELLRHIYDNCPNSFCMVLAFTATAAELNILFSPFVLSRVSRQIVMNFLQLDEAKLFIKGILDTARIDVSKRAGFFPFEDDTIHGIVSQIVSITPRKVINAMQQILEEVRLLNVDPTQGLITTAFLEDNGIIDEVLGT
jgi:hypothetical protein